MIIMNTAALMEADGVFFLGSVYFSQGLFIHKALHIPRNNSNGRNYRHYDKKRGKISGRKIRGFVTSKIHNST